MLAIVSLLVVVAFSLLITRTAAVALTYTGLSQQAAQFQARSAFTGVGFTTTESESVVDHPVRRRIVMLLMLVGNAGIVTAVSALILSFVNMGEGQSVWLRALVLVGGLALMVGLTKIPWVDRQVHLAIEKALMKWTDLDVRDYAQLLCLTGDYGVSELLVEKEDWLAGKALAEAKLDREGVVVLGIHRGPAYNGAPTGATRIEPHDRLILYGRSQQLAQLDIRCHGPAGDREHDEACQAQAETEGGTA